MIRRICDSIQEKIKSKKQYCINKSKLKNKKQGFLKEIFSNEELEILKTCPSVKIIIGIEMMGKTKISKYKVNNDNKLTKVN